MYSPLGEITAVQFEIGEKMEEILSKMGLNSLIPIFEKEKISPDIICKLSLYDMQCLGITDRAEMMKLRTECIPYGHFKPGLDEKRQFEIPKEILETLIEACFTVSDICKMLSVSESTIYRRMRQFNLSKFNFTNVDDEQLDSIVKETIEEFPHCGEAMIRQLLFQKNIKVPRSDLRECLHRLDEIGVKERRRGRLHRRVYNVIGPNHLWHVDTNHKLIRWHLIIAGGIDGFSRLITFLKCTDNNRAETILNCFLEGVNKFGIPLRVRSDQGMENSKIADYMISSRGSNCNSMITGKSTHNQRIERLWRDVYEGVLCYYYDLFHFMEDQGIMDIMNDIHIYALHHVYLSKINMKLTIWQNAWAKHRIRTVRSSPIRLFTAGLVNNPVDIPATDVENYGIEGNVHFDNEEENPRPIFVAPAIEINEQCQIQLGVHCPYNWNSSNFGIDIYTKAVRILETHSTYR